MGPRLRLDGWLPDQRLKGFSGCQDGQNDHLQPLDHQPAGGKGNLLLFRAGGCQRGCLPAANRKGKGAAGQVPIRGRNGLPGDGVDPIRQRAQRDGHVGGIIGIDLHIPLVHRLRVGIQHGDRAQAGFQRLAKKELHLGGRARQDGIGVRVRAQQQGVGRDRHHPQPADQKAASKITTSDET